MIVDDERERERERERDDFEQELAQIEENWQQEQLTSQKKQRRFTSLQRRAENWRQQLATARQQLAREQHGRQGINFQYQSLQQIRRRLEAQNNDLQGQITNLVRDNTDLTAVVNGCYQVIAELRAKNNELSSEKKVYDKKSHDRLLSEIELSWKILREKQEEMEEAKWEAFLKEGQVNALEITVIGNLRREWDQEKREVEEIYQHERDVWNQVLQNEEQATAAVKQQLTQSQQDLNQATTQNNTLQQQNQRQQERIAEQDDKIRELQAENRKLKNKERREDSGYGEEEIMKDDEKERLAEENAELNEEIRELKNEKANWEDEIQGLQDNLTSEQAKRKKYTSYYTRINVKLAQKQALIENLKQDLNRLAQEYRQEKGNHNLELERQIREKQEIIQSLENQLTTLNQIAEAEIDEFNQINRTNRNQINNQNVPPQSNWKSRFISRSGLLTLLATNLVSGYGGYKWGRNTDDLIQSNCLNNNNQLTNISKNKSLEQSLPTNFTPVCPNSVPSSPEYFLENFYQTIIAKPNQISPLADNIDNDLDTSQPVKEPKLNLTTAKNSPKELISVEPQAVETHLKPSDLPDNWKEQLASISPLKRENVILKQKLSGLVDPAIYRTDWINPTDLEAQAQKKGMVSPEEYNQRPDLTKTEYERLRNNQTPLNLPVNWETELKRIPPLEANKTKLEWTNKELEEKIAELSHRPPQEKYDEVLTKLGEKEAEITRQNGVLQTKDRQLINLENEIAKKIGEKNSFADHLTDTEKKLAHQTTKLDNSQKENSRLNEQISTLNEHLKNKTDEVAELNQKVRGQVTDYKEKTDKLNSTLTDTKDSLDKREKELEQTRKTNIDLTTKLIEKERESERIRGEKDTLINSLNETIAEQGKKINDLEEEVAKLPELIDKLTKLEADNSDLNQPRIIQKIFSQGTQIIKSYPIESAATGTALAIYGKEWLKKWRNIHKVRDLEEEKVKLEREKFNLQQEHDNWKNKYQQEKTRADGLQSQITNHNCSPCNLTHLDSHICQPCNLEHCSHSDYQQLKEHIYPKVCAENYHQTIKLEREKEIISRINTDCKLGCAADSSLDQVINKIKELMAGPGGESLTLIIQVEKESMQEVLSPNLFNIYHTQLKQVSNYQQLTAARSAILKEQLKQNTQSLTTVPPKSNWITPQTICLGSLVITLLSAGGLLILKSRKNSKTDLLPNKNGSGKITLQQINQYLMENQIKSLEIDKEGRSVIRFS